MSPTHEQLQVKITLAGNARVHYIEAGNPSLPTLLLLHDFPSSAFQFRSLISHLSPQYHILAPTFPGFGHTEPGPSYTFTFASLTSTLSSFLGALDVRSYAAYTTSYSTPILLRLALSTPTGPKLAGLISANGRVFTEEALSAAFWTPIRTLWNAKNSHPARDRLRNTLLTLDATEKLYRAGVPASKQASVDAAAYALDYMENLAPESGRQEAQLDLLYDFRANVELWPRFRAWLRDGGVPVLAVWGRGDPVYAVEEAVAAVNADAPGAGLRVLETGHFVLGTHVEVVAREIREFLDGVAF